MDITTLTHPVYDTMLSLWDKYTLTYNSGEKFLDEYLERFSQREDQRDFNVRKSISYVPAFAKAAINEIKNAIFQRMIDITRKNGTPSYMNAIAGRDRGVDRKSSTMNNFIGSKVLPPLLYNGKIGVYIDMPSDVGQTQLEQIGKNPYLYLYQAQDIRSWTIDPDDPSSFVALLLRDSVYTYDEMTGLPIDLVNQYRYMRLTIEGVEVTIYNDDSEVIDSRLLAIPKIPFVVMELSQSLLTDVANYQISLMNLASADMNYSFKSNFPFYVEQFDPRRESKHLRQPNSVEPGSADSASESKPQEIVTGATRGRRYPINTERPAYIHPSPEPLKVSMEKQQQLKEEIKLLVNLNLSNLSPNKSSAESKAMDEQSLEAGLSYVGQELENGENRIAEIWAIYENSKNRAIIKYPTHYSLKTDEQRIDEASKLSELRSQVASKTYQKELSKDIANTLLADKAGPEVINIVFKEIDTSEIPVLDPDTISKDIEQGLLSTATASKAKGYPEGEVEKAKEEHAERAARIVMAQTKAAELKNPASRGVPDLGDGKDSDRTDTTTDVVVRDKTRGEAQ